MSEIQNTISYLGIWTIILTIFFIIIIFGIFFSAPKIDAIEKAKKELFNKKHKKEIFDEIDNFTDEEREKLLFLIKEKIKEKKEKTQKFFNDWKIIIFTLLKIF